MKKLISVSALTLLFGSAFAQNIGPAPQTGMEKPGITNGAKANGAMDATGTSIEQGKYQKGQGRCTGPEGREEVSCSLTVERPSFSGIRRQP